MNMLLATCCLLLAGASALPRYIAVPADQIQFLDLAALQAHARMPRQAPQYVPRYEQPYRLQGQADAVEAASDERPARHAHAHHDTGDYVDFGAHTGGHGAFGWYADYPIQSHH